MSQPIKSISKISRSLGEKLFLKGSRDEGPKNAMTRRPYPPGQHGLSRRSKPSDYAKQLKEKQKLRYIYNLSEKQLRNMVKKASKSKTNTAQALLKILESRIDNVVHIAGFASSRRQSSQLVAHRHVVLNGKKVSIPSITTRPGDKLQITSTPVDTSKDIKKENIPAWLNVDIAKATIEVVAEPSTDRVSNIVEAQLIIEYYSRLI